MVLVVKKRTVIWMSTALLPSPCGRATAPFSLSVALLVGLSVWPLSRRSKTKKI